MAIAKIYWLGIAHLQKQSFIYTKKNICVYTYSYVVYMCSHRNKKILTTHFFNIVSVLLIFRFLLCWIYLLAYIYGCTMRNMSILLIEWNDLRFMWTSSIYKYSTCIFIYIFRHRISATTLCLIFPYPQICSDFIV